MITPQSIPIYRLPAHTWGAVRTSPLWVAPAMTGAAAVQVDLHSEDRGGQR
jgi:hypothetical protein